MRFNNAEDAWFWFKDWEKADAENKKFVTEMNVLEWPCEPIHIYAALIRLRQQEIVTNAEIDVLNIFGFFGYVPDKGVYPGNWRYTKKLRGDADGRDERYAYKKWSRAMSKLNELLISINIVTDKETNI